MSSRELNSALAAPDRRGIHLILVAVAACIFALDPVAFAAERPDYPNGGTYVSASLADPINLIPILATDSASAAVCDKVFNGLVRYNPKLELEGDLAQSWDIRDEGKTIVFFLRRDVFWHDGKQFDAFDVVFTYQKLIDPEIPSPYGGDFKEVTDIEALNPFVVKVSYSKPFSPGLASWTMGMLPRHLLEKENLLETDFTRHPVGTGPYKFKRWVTGEKVALEAYDRYYEGRPRLDRVISRIIPDQTTAFLELQQGSIDSTGLTPLQFTRQTDTKFFRENYQKFRYPSFGYTYLGFNLTHPLFRDVRVRQAINAAIDKEEIINTVLLGLGRVCTGPFTPESWAFNPGVKSQPFDPELARSMLRSAGWDDTDGDGILDKDDQAFAFTIITNQGNTQRQQAAEIIQRRLKEIGMKVEIKVVEWSAFLKEFIDKRRFEAVLLGWGLSRDPDPNDIWHSSKRELGGFNFLGYFNPRVDQLIEDGRSTFDRTERRRIYHEIHRTIYSEQPSIFLFIQDATPVVHRRFHNIEVTALGLGYNFIDWYVTKNERKYPVYSTHSTHSTHVP